MHWEASFFRGREYGQEVPESCKAGRLGRVGGMDEDGDSEPAHQREAYRNAWEPFNPHEEEGIETRSEQGREEDHQEEEDQWENLGKVLRTPRNPTQQDDGRPSPGGITGGHGDHKYRL